MRRFKFFLNFEKEENWLNQMGAEGFEFVGKTMGYRFRLAKPEKANIKIDYRTFKNSADFLDYCTLFEDCGWKHIAGTKGSGTQYFKKARANADEDIFSDSDSKAGRYKRLSQMYIGIAFCYLPIFSALITTGVIDAASFLDPKKLYLTPGIWEKAGADFWGAFLFETPFVIFRTATWLLFPIMIILFSIFSFKADKHYKESIK